MLVPLSCPARAAGFSARRRLAGVCVKSETQGALVRRKHVNPWRVLLQERLHFVHRRKCHPIGPRTDSGRAFEAWRVNGYRHFHLSASLLTHAHLQRSSRSVINSDFISVMSLRNTSKLHPSIMPISRAPNRPIVAQRYDQSLGLGHRIFNCPGHCDLNDFSVHIYTYENSIRFTTWS